MNMQNSYFATNVRKLYHISVTRQEPVKQNILGNCSLSENGRGAPYHAGNLHIYS